ncbi:MAG TPA: hypothetical protein VGV64_03425 [Thermoplasmata archaeon]|nr:hypothetical protein [Thermoplasmata archaeon]
MRSGPARGSSPPKAIALAWAVLLVGSGFVGLAGTAALAPPTGGTASGVRPLASGVRTFDDGLVRLTFLDPLPGFTVTSDQDPRVASVHSLERIAEVTPTGNVSAYAPLQSPNATWSITPSSDGTTVWLNATAPVVFTRGVWESDDDLSSRSIGPGNANVSLTFHLNGSTGIALDAVSFDVAVTSWPWIDFRDFLGLDLGTTAVTGTTLSAGTSPNSLVELANASRHLVSTLSWAASASVAYSGGAGSNSTVGTYRTFSTDESSSTVLLQFVAPRGGYADLEYDPLVELNLSAFAHPLPIALPAWVISSGALETIAAAGVVVALLAGVAYRSRSKPARRATTSRSA